MNLNGLTAHDSINITLIQAYVISIIKSDLIILVAQEKVESIFIIKNIFLLLGVMTFAL